MTIETLLFILGGGFAGTWGLCIYFMSRSDQAVLRVENWVREDIREIRLEISELKNCIKDHHSRICIIEERK